MIPETTPRMYASAPAMLLVSPEALVCAGTATACDGAATACAAGAGAPGLVDCPQFPQNALSAATVVPQFGQNAMANLLFVTAPSSPLNEHRSRPGTTTLHRTST